MNLSKCIGYINLKLIPVSLFDLNSNVFIMMNDFKGSADQSTKHAVTNLMALLHYTSIYLHTLHKLNCEYNLIPIKMEIYPYLLNHYIHLQLPTSEF